MLIHLVQKKYKNKNIIHAMKFDFQFIYCSILLFFNILLSFTAF